MQEDEEIEHLFKAVDADESGSSSSSGAPKKKEKKGKKEKKTKKEKGKKDLDRLCPLLSKSWQEKPPKGGKPLTPEQQAKKRTGGLEKKRKEGAARVCLSAVYVRPSRMLEPN